MLLTKNSTKIKKFKKYKDKKRTILNKYINDYIINYKNNNKNTKLFVF